MVAKQMAKKMSSMYCSNRTPGSSLSGGSKSLRIEFKIPGVRQKPCGILVQVYLCPLWLSYINICKVLMIRNEQRQCCLRVGDLRSRRVYDRFNGPKVMRHAIR